MPMELVQDPNLISQLNAQVQPQQPTGGYADPMQALFPGVKSDLTGDAYLKQFPPEFQQGVVDYVAGRTMPTGNSKRADVIKTIARKYGGDIGMPADDTSFTERRTLRNQLASGSPQSMGGQFRNGTTAMEHLSKAAIAAEKLKNWDLGIPVLSHAANTVRSELSTDQKAASDALAAAADHYGQEIVKFYAGGPGGQAERMRFLSSLSNAKSPKELAAVLEMEQSLIPAKMDQIIQEIDAKLGHHVGEKEYGEKKKLQQQYRDTLNSSVAAMRGEKVAPAAGEGVPSAAPVAAPTAPAAPALRDGMSAINPQTGERLIYRNGAWSPTQ